jgi:lysophospholipase L1-like esterase
MAVNANTMMDPLHPRKIAAILAFIGALLLAFAWGAWTIYGRVFPFNQLRELRNWAAAAAGPAEKSPGWLETSALFEQSTFKASVVMVGDSLTAQGRWPELLSTPLVANRGILGDTAEFIGDRLAGVLAPQPQQVFIMAGINDLHRGQSVDRVFQSYRMIVGKLRQANARVVIQSTLRCNPALTEFDSSTLNGKIDGLNEKLRQLEEADGAVVFVDINAVLSDGDGLKRQYTTDGVHLNLSGYQAWAAKIRPLIP